MILPPYIVPASAVRNRARHNKYLTPSKAYATEKALILNHTHCSLAIRKATFVLIILLKDNKTHCFVCVRSDLNINLIIIFISFIP